MTAFESRAVDEETEEAVVGFMASSRKENQNDIDAVSMEELCFFGAGLTTR